MESKRVICRNCRYFAPGALEGVETEGSAKMGECLNPESDYEHRTVDETFGCDAFEPRGEE
jgi:hypothetical protein